MILGLPATFAQQRNRDPSILCSHDFSIMAHPEHNLSQAQSRDRLLSFLTARSLHAKMWKPDVEQDKQGVLVLMPAPKPVANLRIHIPHDNSMPASPLSSTYGTNEWLRFRWGTRWCSSGTTWEASAWTSSSYSTRAARPDAPNFDDLPLTRLNARKPCGHSVYHFCSLTR